ncbi:hypothetical protein EOD39_2358 [Acipenser ruthenus]|uniref:Uncharacterized protein n=1 Tax=Acipenser ruthenus TaxID=7906 RepID=A0A444U239_ACIRT|nr:hypothetical protein EOD39_2358 [Acipenser ruthenus]
MELPVQTGASSTVGVDKEKKAEKRLGDGEAMKMKYTLYGKNGNMKEYDQQEMKMETDIKAEMRTMENCGDAEQRNKEITGGGESLAGEDGNIIKESNEEQTNTEKESKEEETNKCLDKEIGTNGNSSEGDEKENKSKREHEMVEKKTSTGEKRKTRERENKADRGKRKRMKGNEITPVESESPIKASGSDKKGGRKVMGSRGEKERKERPKLKGGPQGERLESLNKKGMKSKVHKVAGSKARGKKQILIKFATVPQNQSCLSQKMRQSVQVYYKLGTRDSFSEACNWPKQGSFDNKEEQQVETMCVDPGEAFLEQTLMPIKGNGSEEKGQLGDSFTDIQGSEATYSQVIKDSHLIHGFTAQHEPYNQCQNGCKNPGAAGVGFKAPETLEQKAVSTNPQNNRETLNGPRVNNNLSNPGLIITRQQGNREPHPKPGLMDPHTYSQNRPNTSFQGYTYESLHFQFPDHGYWDYYYRTGDLYNRYPGLLLPPRNWPRPFSPVQEESVPISPSQRPEREAMKERARQERGEAARITKHGLVHNIWIPNEDKIHYNYFNSLKKHRQGQAKSPMPAWVCNG